MEGSFEDFVLKQGEALLRVAVMLCGDRGRAEDLVQSALIRAYPHWDRVAAMERPAAYMRAVIVREHLRWWGRRLNHEIPAAVAYADRPGRPDVAQQNADRQAAWELLGRLPARQRAVLVLRYYEDMSDSEIARTLRCSESTVRSQAARGLAALRAIVPTIDREALP